MISTVAGGVYAITNTATGEQYIGSAANVRARVLQHFSTLRSGKHPNKHLQAAFNQYGEAAFQTSMLEEVAAQAERLEREQHYFVALAPAYNIATKPAGRPSVIPQRTQINTYVHAETLARINAARGQTPLAEWVRDVIEQRLDRDITH